MFFLMDATLGDGFEGGQIEEGRRKVLQKEPEK
jgi:hypothetical protein